MAVQSIRLYPDDVLRRRCRSVASYDDDLRRLVADMIETMHSAPGVGLAAPQIGVELKVAVVDVTVGDVDDAMVVLINPEIVEDAGAESDVEGCLSIPEFTAKVVRPTWIRVHAQNLEGEPVEIEAENFVARAICHEIDHLSGILFVDRLRGLRRDRGRRFLKRLRREAMELTA